MEKLGRPGPGQRRRLTGAESAHLGCSKTWWVWASPSGIVLLRPYRKHEWDGPGPRLGRVDLTYAALTRMRAKLAAFWDQKRHRVISNTVALRMTEALESALTHGLTVPVRREIQWMLGVLA